jgi:hypothetical protein
MKIHSVVFFQLLFSTISIFAFGVFEYNGQNYFLGMGTSDLAIDYAKNGQESEASGLEFYDVIIDGKFFFIESATSNFNIIELITQKGYIEYGDEIEIKRLTGVPFHIIEDEYGNIKKEWVDFECIYCGEKIYIDKTENIDFFVTLIGYSTNRKIIITEIFLTAEAFDQKRDQFIRIDE